MFVNLINKELPNDLFYFILSFINIIDINKLVITNSILKNMILNDNEKNVLFLNKKVNKEIFIDIKQRLVISQRNTTIFFW